MANDITSYYHNQIFPLLDNLRELRDVESAYTLAAGPNIFQVKKTPVLISLVPESIGESSAVFFCSPNELSRDPCYVQGKLLLRTGGISIYV